MMVKFKIFTLIAFLGNISQVLCGEKLIIDTDPGVDDAFAILLMLTHQKLDPSAFEIVAVTTIYGNTKERYTSANALKLLSIAGRGDIPVYSGAKKGFVQEFHSDYHYELDGFGNATLDLEITAEIDRSKHAAQALVDIAKQNSGNISIVALGPLTNIGLAISLNENFTSYVNNFYVMGGSVNGVGNKRPNVEFNFDGDPESNFLLFHSVEESQIVLLPWEVSWNTGLTKKWRKEVLGRYNSTFMTFLNKIEESSLTNKRPQWFTADVMISVCIIEPKAITKYTLTNIEAVTDGKARGSILIDYTNKTDKQKNTKLIQAIDEKLYVDMLFKYLTCENVPC